MREVEETIALARPDLNYLKELSGGDSGFVAEIIKMFIEDAPKIIGQVHQYLHKGDYELLRVTVHKLKSSIQVLGCHRMTTLVQEIETQCGLVDERDSLPGKIEYLEQGVNDLIKPLEAELESL